MSSSDASAWNEGGAMTLCVVALSGDRHWLCRGCDESKAPTGAAHAH